MAFDTTSDHPGGSRDPGFPAPPTLEAALLADVDQAEAKAWDALARYKFMMFGYWAAVWVHLNRVGGLKRPNPWAGLVKLARARAA